MYNRLYKYFHENSIQYDKQFAFQKNNSTDHAILQAVASSDESDEEDEVYQICKRVNTPGCGNKMQWEGCNNCDLWYHEQCLN